MCAHIHVHTSICMQLQDPSWPYFQPSSQSSVPLPDKYGLHHTLLPVCLSDSISYLIHSCFSPARDLLGILYADAAHTLFTMGLSAQP